MLVYVGVDYIIYIILGKSKEIAPTPPAAPNRLHQHPHTPTRSKNTQLTRRSCTPSGMHFACLGRSVDGFVVPGSWVVVVLRGIGGLGGAEGTSCRSRWVVVCWFCVRACPRALCVMGGMRSCRCAFGSSGHQNGASRARER